MPRGLIHSEKDDVCVATTDVKKGEEVLCAYLENNSKHEIIKTLDDVPLGHKIALRDIRQGEKVLKYGRPIGVATTNISKGQHVHIHNLKSIRWSK
ncbi:MULTISPECIES: UxaA family hydrolase [Metallosphaera]|uniref:SAF domain protein n=3 Tax=Metallosphaera TaxID=41980 RepID=A4YFT3_METS5|nr:MULTISPECIES: UxaA family hydrolase [Metallosphaera]ABP95285.1 SAF domain protein [Metallosphaera sedula DSM 5348]AIM27271.1 SAF domain protein [Metallosphaera sedula]AKV74159.1 dehydratase [Metallosphaera sedula]AKV76398.1 dehydratase [Metallosphaera sedula]AKV78650.1 dehydratase [Metallosphaera sedula]